MLIFDSSYISVLSLYYLCPYLLSVKTRVVEYSVSAYVHSMLLFMQCAKIRMYIPTLQLLSRNYIDAVLLVYILYVTQTYNIFLLLYNRQNVHLTRPFYWSICLSALTSLHNSWNAIIENTIKPVLYAFNTPISYIKSTLKKSIWKTTRPCAPNVRDFFSNVYHSLYRKNR